VPNRQVFGEVTEDPLLSMPLGSKIAFQPSLFMPEISNGLHGLENWDFFDGAVVALHFGTSYDSKILGSGSIVAPGVALIAKHVVEPQIEALKSGGEGFICSSITRAGIVIWSPRQITMLDNSDLALVTLSLSSAPPAVFKQVTLSTHLPKVGDLIHVAGYRHHLEKGVGLSINLKPVAAGVLV